MRAMREQHGIHDEDAMWAFVGVMFWAHAALAGDIRTAKDGIELVGRHYTRSAKESAAHADAAAQRSADHLAQVERAVEAAKRHSRRIVRLGFGAVALVAVSVSVYGAVAMYDAGRAGAIETVRGHSPDMADRLFRRGPRAR